MPLRRAEAATIGVASGRQRRDHGLGLTEEPVELRGGYAGVGLRQRQAELVHAPPRRFGRIDDHDLELGSLRQALGASAEPTRPAPTMTTLKGGSLVAPAQPWKRARNALRRSLSGRRRMVSGRPWQRRRGHSP